MSYLVRFILKDGSRIYVQAVNVDPATQLARTDNTTAAYLSRKRNDAMEFMNRDQAVAFAAQACMREKEVVDSLSQLKFNGFEVLKKGIKI